MKLTDEQMQLSDREKAELITRRFTGKSKLQVEKLLDDCNAVELSALAQAAEINSTAQCAEVLNFAATRQRFEALHSARNPSPAGSDDETELA